MDNIDLWPWHEIKWPWTLPISALVPERELAVRSSHWSAVRAAHLRTEPRCCACGASGPLEVHHIKPFHLFPALELDPANLITLCEGAAVNCHFLFGHLLSWRCYNPDVRGDAAAWLGKIGKRAAA